MSASQSVVERFQIAVDLWTTGVTLRRQSIRRQYPEATAEEVEQRLSQWLQHRPGAEDGDGPPRGTP